jgi:hypothetical protein
VPVNDDNDFNIFPNPTRGILRIETEDLVKIEILDLTGRLLKTYAVHQRNQLIDLSDFGKGMYAARLTTTNGAKSQKILLE